MTVDTKHVFNVPYILSMSFLLEGSSDLLSEEIADVEGRIKKKIEQDYIEAMARFKGNVERELTETIELLNSGTIKSVKDLVDKVDKTQLKYMKGSLELIDKYYNEAKRSAEALSKALAIGQHEVDSLRGLHEFLENRRKSPAVKAWSSLVDSLGKSKNLINKLGEHAPATKELVNGYIDILEIMEDSSRKYIATLNILKQKLETKRGSMSVEDIETDEELRERFLSRVADQVEKQLGREISEEDQRLIDIVIDVMQGDVGKEEKETRKKMKSRDVEYQRAKSREAPTGAMTAAG